MLSFVCNIIRYKQKSPLRVREICVSVFFETVTYWVTLGLRFLAHSGKSLDLRSLDHAQGYGSLCARNGPDEEGTANDQLLNTNYYRPTRLSRFGG